MCARLPYWVIVNNPMTGDDDVLTYSLLDDFEEVNSDYPKPYLRPMSSMTMEEQKEWFEQGNVDYDCEFKPEPTVAVGFSHLSVDWLNAHHFDYRGLIKKGLALPAPEGMYEIN